jgi:hypothetical protein
MHDPSYTLALVSDDIDLLSRIQSSLAGASQIRFDRRPTRSGRARPVIGSSCMVNQAAVGVQHHPICGW